MNLKLFCKRCANRKGAAMELAILVIVVTLTLSVLVVTTALLQHSRRQKTAKNMEQIVVLESIGERFCNDSASGSPINWITQYDGYRIEHDVSNETLSVYNADTDELLMVVQMNGHTIVSWNKK